MIVDFAYRNLRLLFLGPFAMLWEAVYYIRRFLYNFKIMPSHSYQVPVISIGNLTFGGTGKTPFTIWLSDFLAKKERASLILTRGYKGDFEHSSGVLKGGDIFRFNPSKFGDEALIIAKKLKAGAVVVGKNRVKNLEHYFHKLSPDVVLLDDGHQHLKLNRNLNIVLFDALLPLSRYKVAPLGYLREGMNALADADAVVISRADQVPVSKINSLRALIDQYSDGNTPVVEASFKCVGFYDSNFKFKFSPEELKGRRIVAMAGLGSPQSFFNLLQSLGGNIVDRFIFADHYFYKEEDILKIIKRAEELDAMIITSEKDMVKVRRISTENEIFYVSIEMDFASGKEELIELIESTCNMTENYRIKVEN